MSTYLHQYPEHTHTHIYIIFPFYILINSIYPHFNVPMIYPSKFWCPHPSTSKSHVRKCCTTAGWIISSFWRSHRWDVGCRQVVIYIYIIYDWIGGLYMDGQSMVYIYMVIVCHSHYRLDRQKLIKYIILCFFAKTCEINGN